MEAPYPTNEPERVRALRRYAILDTLPEQTYDDITRLAASICGTPIALISLVDADRQWFKSRVGLPETAEMPRAISFCSHAILQEGVFEVGDAAADARFCDNPLVIGEANLRFYAGAPLVTSEGEALGAVCVLDRVPRTLDAAQKAALESLSRLVMSQMERRRAEVERAEFASRQAQFALRQTKMAAQQTQMTAPADAAACPAGAASAGACGGGNKIPRHLRERCRRIVPNVAGRPACAVQPGIRIYVRLPVT